MTAANVVSKIINCTGGRGGMEYEGLRSALNRKVFILANVIDFRYININVSFFSCWSEPELLPEVNAGAVIGPALLY